MTVGVILPNLTNKRNLAVNLLGEEGHIPLFQFISAKEGRDYLRVYIDGTQEKNRPRITYNLSENILEVALAFPSFKKDKMNRESSFAIIFSKDEDIINKLLILKDHHPDYSEDFVNAINFLKANIKNLIATLEISSKVICHGEITDVNDPIVANGKKKVLKLVILLMILAIIILTLSRNYESHSKKTSNASNSSIL